MLLCIDIGNTQTTLGLINRQGSVKRQWRLASNTTDTQDMLQLYLSGYFDMFHEDLAAVSHTAIASVVPILTQQWIGALQQAFGQNPFIVDATQPCGIAIDMPYPSQVGADRIANALGAKITYGSPVVVVDFGTATNIDVVDRNGSFRGGAIMPGFMLSAQSLFQRAAKLSSVPLTVPDHALGTTTEQAVQSGIVLGAISQVEGLVTRICKELSIEDATIVATGGASKTLAGATKLFDALDSDLTLRGIWHIWEHSLHR